VLCDNATLWEQKLLWACDHQIPPLRTVIHPGPNKVMEQHLQQRVTQNQEKCPKETSNIYSSVFCTNHKKFGNEWSVVSSPGLVPQKIFLFVICQDEGDEVFEPPWELYQYKECWNRKGQSLNKLPWPGRGKDIENKMCYWTHI